MDQRGTSRKVKILAGSIGTFFVMAILIVGIITGGRFIQVAKTTDNRTYACMACVNCPDDIGNSWCGRIPGGHHPDAPPKPGEARTHRDISDEAKKEEAEAYREATGRDIEHPFYALAVEELRRARGETTTTPSRSTSKQAFDNRSGVWGEYGVDCDASRGTCTGTVTIYSCDPSQIQTGPTRTVNGRTEGGGPICINSPVQTSGTVDCVSEANKRCAFVQLDVKTTNPLSGSAMTCYPTDYSRCTVVEEQEIITSPSTRSLAETNPTNPPGGGNSPSPTTPPQGQCESIRVYDASDVDITEALRNGTRRLSVGETVTLATAKGTATKARFRIQGVTQFAENNPSLTTNNEYRLAIQIPSTITQAQGSFEAELSIGGSWR